MFKNHAGFHITENRLHLVEVNYADDIFVLENVDSEYFDEFLSLVDKETRVIDILQNAFDEIILRNPLKSNSASFVIPDRVFKIFEIPFEQSLVNKDLAEHVNWEFSVLFPNEQPENYATRFIKVDDDKQDRLIVYAISKKVIRTLHKFCSRNNLQLKYVDNAHLAANSIVSIADDKPENYLSVYYGNSFFSFGAFAEGKPLYYNVRKISSMNQFIEYLEVERGRFEKLGITGNFTTSYLFGANISESLKMKIEEKTDLKFLLPNPFHYIDVAEQFEKGKLYSEDYAFFNSAAGIAYRML